MSSGNITAGQGYSPSFHYMEQGLLATLKPRVYLHIRTGYCLGLHTNRRAYFEITISNFL